MSTPTLKSADLVKMLRGHYGGTPSKPSAGYFATEIEAPDSTRRIDGVWLPLHAAQRGQIIGHEIKVSRADVMAELADPMKSHAWSKFCNRWWLVIPDLVLVRGLEIPEHWGIMTPPDGRRSSRLMHVARPAPALQPQDQHLAYAQLLARIFYAGDDQGTMLRRVREDRDNLAARERPLQQRVYELQAEVRRLGGTELTPGSALHQRVVDVLAAVQRIPGWEISHAASQIPVDTVVEALADVARVRASAAATARDIDYRLTQLDYATDTTTLDKARAKLRAAADNLKEYRS